MSDLTAKVTETSNGYHVEGYEKIEYDFAFVDGVFETQNPELADIYKRWGRCLLVTDENLAGMYCDAMKRYFVHHRIAVEIFPVGSGEYHKTMKTALSIVDKMMEFGIIRKEPVLVVGGGLVTDVAGFACAMFRRTTNFIRVPTTLIGLIDASVSIKVGLNHTRAGKNKLGAYHAPIHTFLDFNFLKTLPVAQVRNGFAELIKISSCADLETFDMLDGHCEDLINSGFARNRSAALQGQVDLASLKKIADSISQRSILLMLELESPNLHELSLKRIIAFGHTVSPTLELAIDPHLRHGHAISIDMCYSTTLAWKRGLISEAEHKRMLNLFSRAGLSMDHDNFNVEVLLAGIKAILGTRDGDLQGVVPHPLGSCIFLNDVTDDEFIEVLALHKQVVKQYPRQGAGIEAYVDIGDLGVETKDILPDATCNCIKQKPQQSGIVTPPEDDSKNIVGIDAKEKAGLDLEAVTNGDNRAISVVV